MKKEKPKNDMALTPMGMYFGYRFFIEHKKSDDRDFIALFRQYIETEKDIATTECGKIVSMQNEQIGKMLGLINDHNDCILCKVKKWLKNKRK